MNRYKTPWELEHERGNRLYFQFVKTMNLFNGNIPWEAEEIESNVKSYANHPIEIRDLGVQRKLNRLYASSIERLELILKLSGIELSAESEDKSFRPEDMKRMSRLTDKYFDARNDVLNLVGNDGGMMPEPYRTDFDRIHREHIRSPELQGNMALKSFNTILAHYVERLELIKEQLQSLQLRGGKNE